MAPAAMPAPDPPPALSPESLARRHRRMQLGFGLREEDDLRGERIAARPDFEAVEKEGRWVLGFGSALAVALSVALWVKLSGTPKPPETRVDPARTVVPTQGRITSRPVIAPTVPAAFPTNVTRVTGPILATVSPTSASAPMHYEPPRVPAAVAGYPPPPTVPTPDYAARDRQIAELKRRSDSLDDLARNVRANSGNSHASDTGFPDYQAWRHQHNGWTNSESLNQYLKALDQHRDEVRREKWRLEGR